MEVLICMLRKKVKKGIFSFNFSIGVFSLCFESTTNSQTTVSFDFFDDKKEDQLISVRKYLKINIQSI
jgi:hypothetical protein